MPPGLSNAAAKLRAASQRLRSRAAPTDAQRLAVRAQAYEFGNRMRYGVAQPSAAFSSPRSKVPAAAPAASTGTAGLEPLLGQLVHAVRTAVDMFALAVSTLLSCASHLTSIEQHRASCLAWRNPGG
jgi:hypothetical protein